MSARLSRSSAECRRILFRVAASHCSSASSSYFGSSSPITLVAAVSKRRRIRGREVGAEQGPRVFFGTDRPHGADEAYRRVGFGRPPKKNLFVVVVGLPSQVRDDCSIGLG